MNRARAVQKRKMLDERAKVSQGDGSTHTEPYEKHTKDDVEAPQDVHSAPTADTVPTSQTGCIIASRVGSTSVVSKQDWIVLVWLFVCFATTRLHCCLCNI